MSEEHMMSGDEQLDDDNFANAIGFLSLRAKLAISGLPHLPTELILLICSHLCPIRPMQEVFESRPTQSFDSVCDTLQQERCSVRNLSITNKRLRRCIADSGILYRTVYLKGDSFCDTVSFLSKLKANPAIGPAVRMLYMNLCYELYPIETSTPAPLQYQLDFVLDMASSCNLRYPAILRSSTALVPSYNHHCEWTSLLARAILAQMPYIEHVGLKIMDRTFAGEEPRPNSTFEGPRLPNLRSVALRLEDGNCGPPFHRRTRYYRDYDLLVDVSPFGRLYVESVGVRPTMKLLCSHSSPKFDTLTNITLNGSPVEESDLSMMLNHCTSISVFRYIAYSIVFPTIPPARLVRILQQTHEKSLRTLCIAVGFRKRDNQAAISTLGSFTNLESLWIDLDSVNNSDAFYSPANTGDETGNNKDPSRIDPQPKQFFFTLPRAIKRMFFYKVWREHRNSLDWLSSKEGRLSFPELEEVAFHDAETEAVNRIGSRFSNGASRHTYVSPSIWE